MGYRLSTLYKLDSEGGAGEFRLFTLFVHALIDSGYAWRTVELYSTTVMHFIDALYISCDDLDSLSLADVKLFYRSYHAYLIDGVQASDQKLARIAQAKGHVPITRQSSATYHAGIDSFLKFSDKLCTERARNLQCGVDVEYLPDENLLVMLGLVSPMSLKKRERSVGSDEGKTTLPNNRLSTHIAVPRHGSNPIDKNKYFPLGRITEVLHNARSDRELALYALLAASSIRVSEAMQLLIEDIDFVERKVYIIDPSSRKNFNYAYQGLSYFEKKKLCWKGRTTSHTLLLEPYGDIFFNALERFIIQGKSSRNNFLFCTKSGKPLFLADYSRVVLDPFKRAAGPIYESLGFSLEGVGLHSFRHSYCYFMLNFVERNGGLGMSPYELIQLTGHASISGLETYAKVDLEKIYEDIAVAQEMFVDPAGISEAAYHVKYLERRIEEWKRIVRAEELLKSQMEVEDD